MLRSYTAACCAALVTGALLAQPCFAQLPGAKIVAEIKISGSLPENAGELGLFGAVDKNLLEMVSRLDRDVGRIVDLVDELGIAENTLIIFTSDNGPTPAGGADPEFFDGNGIYRGIKFSFYEGGIRCPMIARWPGTIEKGMETDHISAHWDVLPTMAELAGVDVPEGVDGISFLPALKGESENQKAHDYLYWEWPSRNGWQAARKGQWKAHWTGTRKGLEKATFELYDLSEDIAEEVNVAEQFPDIATTMKKIMAEAHVPENDGPDPLFTPAPRKKKKK